MYCCLKINLIIPCPCLRPAAIASVFPMSSLVTSQPNIAAWHLDALMPSPSPTKVKHSDVDEIHPRKLGYQTWWPGKRYKQVYVYISYSNMALLSFHDKISGVPILKENSSLDRLHKKNTATNPLKEKSPFQVCQPHEYPTSPQNTVPYINDSQ